MSTSERRPKATEKAKATETPATGSEPETNGSTRPPTTGNALPETTVSARRPQAASARPSAAVAAEPLGIGTSGARDPLAVEVRLLGALLGQVISEQAGPELFATVERIRRRTIALRRDDDPLERARLDEELRALDLDDAEAVIEAFGLYFGLVNLAEAHARVRTLRRRERAARDGVLDDSVADAVGRLRRSGRSNADLDALVARLSVSPVLTAHPTEARRRTTLVALRRCAALLERLDDTRLTPSEDREVRRRLREEITLLWRTSDLRIVTPTPLDEVRTAMAFFDATLFTVVPRLYRALDGALDRGPGRSRGPAADTGRTGTRPPRVGPFLRPGSWIGGDRDGNPEVTADVTLRTLRIQADHVLHGYEAVATRLMQTIAAADSGDRVPRALASRLARDAEDLPETDRELRRRFPDEPYRQRFGFIAERLRRTRAHLVGEPAALTGRYATAADLDAELGRDHRRARGRRPRTRRLGRGRRAAVAAGHVRVPPCRAGSPPARLGPCRRAGRDPRGTPDRPRSSRPV